MAIVYSAAEHLDDDKHSTHADVQAFLRAVAALSKGFGLSISHEDGHGAFKIEPYSEDNIKWLGQAYYYGPGGL